MVALGYLTVLSLIIRQNKTKLAHIVNTLIYIAIAYFLYADESTSTSSVAFTTGNPQPTSNSVLDAEGLFCMSPKCCGYNEGYTVYNITGLYLGFRALELKFFFV